MSDSPLLISFNTYIKGVGFTLGVSIKRHMDSYSSKFLNTQVVFSSFFPLSLLTSLSQCPPF